MKTDVFLVTVDLLQTGNDTYKGGWGSEGKLLILLRSGELLGVIR